MKTILKWVVNFIAGVVVLTGGIWLLQGVGVLPGSYMSGQLQWAVNGGIAMALGGAVLFFVNRRSVASK